MGSTEATLVEVAQNPITGETVRVNEEEINKRNLQLHQPSEVENEVGEDDSGTFLWVNNDSSDVEYTPALQLHRTMQQDWNITDDWARYQVRECQCSYDVVDWYCPSNFTTCAIPSSWDFLSDGDQRPGCMNRQRSTGVIRYVWYFVIVCYAMIVTCLVCTRMGRSIFGYLITCCWRGYNDKVARWIMEKKPEEARRMIYISWVRRRMQLEREYLRAMRNRTPEEIAAAEEARRREEEEAAAAEQRRPTSLALRTCKYSDLIKKTKMDVQPTTPNTSFSKEDEEQQEEAVCTICFGPFQDDDRVGALPCDHIFHVEPCLKSWLSRRNTCPLCVTENVAAPRYEEEEEASDKANGGNVNDGGGMDESGATIATVVELPDTSEASRPPPVLPSQSREFV